jgi:prophage antirepressor-like protein
MSNIPIFDRSEFPGGVVVAYGTRERPLLCAQDVARWLDYSNVAVMLEGVDDNEKVKLKGCISPSYPSPTGGENEYTERWFLTEYGFYELVMQSRKPLGRGLKDGIKQLLYDVRTGRGTMQMDASSVDILLFAITRMLRSKMAAQIGG